MAMDGLRRLGWRGLLGRARREILPLMLMAVSAGGIWSFVEIADEVHEGEIRRLDEAILLALRNPQDAGDPLGPGWLEELGRDFTALGGLGVLSLLSVAACGFLLLAGKRRSALLMALAVAGGIAVSSLLKRGFDRPRPDLVPHETVVYTASFPSGHAMMATVVYLTLGALLARTNQPLPIKSYVLGLAVLLMLLVGLTRIYLGVHWPSDVLAGWAVGAAWASLCWLIALVLQRRGAIEPEAPMPSADGTVREE